MQPLVIAIDGPSGVGKSSTSRGVAQQLGLAYLDTGSMYRAIAIGCQAGGILQDRDGVIGFAMRADLALGTDPASPTIALNGVDVTDEIHLPAVSADVSIVATNQEVRDILTAQMREIIDQSGGIVVEGRDITTVVYPQAQVRVLLVANQAVRMARRQAQIDGQLTSDELKDQVLRRDRDDGTVSNFETPAAGVTLIDSTDMSLDEVITAIIALVPSGTDAGDQVTSNL